MKYRIVFAGLLVLAPLIAMDKNGMNAPNQSEVEQRQAFKNLFFPDVPTSNSQDVLKACRFYSAIPGDLEIMPGVTFEKAKKYAHYHQDKMSAIFRRFSNALMLKTYKPGLSRGERDKHLEEATFSIADNEKLFSYILTGDKVKECTAEEIWDYATVFGKLINSYRHACDIQKPEKVLNG
jgi:hypothetical protein